MKILSELHKRYPNATLHGHREFVCPRIKNGASSSCTDCKFNQAVCEYAAKPCPCFDVSEYAYIFQQ